MERKILVAEALAKDLKFSFSLPKVFIDLGLMGEIIGNRSIHLLQGEEGKTLYNTLRRLTVKERVDHRIE
jgi:hypothetical protein